MLRRIGRHALQVPLEAIEVHDGDRGLEGEEVRGSAGARDSGIGHDQFYPGPRLARGVSRANTWNGYRPRMTPEHDQHD